MNTSIVSKMKHVGHVSFPEPITKTKIYMQSFYQKKGLPKNLEKWQPTVDAMLKGIQTNGPLFLMIDQQFVKAGQYQRRPGLHVDGNWKESLNRHRHIHGKYEPEMIILASNISACRAFTGTFKGIPASDGNCEHIDIRDGNEVTLLAGQVYYSNVTMVHESLPVAEDCNRTLVRINVPGIHLH